MNITLKPELESAIRRLLEDVYTKWLEQQPIDILRHVQRQNAGFNFGTRPHKGTQTWIEFAKTIGPAIHELETELRNSQPELLSYVYTSSTAMVLQAQMWLGTWIKYLDSSPALTTKAKIDGLIADLKHVLAGGAKLIATTMLMGLSLPETIDDIRLQFRDGEEIRLHRMTADEFSKEHSTDMLFDPLPEGMRFSLPDTVLLFEQPADISIRPTAQERLSGDDERIRAEIVSRVVQALTLTKAGHFLPASTSSRIDPSVMPVSFGSFRGAGHMPPTTVVLLPTEIDTLKENLGRLLDGRPEIAIAAKRLVDAEARLNPADAVVDAAIGLETLLLRGRQELTYRVKLNYAFLAPFHERRTRVSELNELYKWRGNIVHGSAGDANLGELHTVATRGKAALRYAILQFLRDPALRKDAKLDNEYWIDRIVRG